MCGWRILRRDAVPVVSDMEVDRAVLYGSQIHRVPASYGFGARGVAGS
jgi:hypothetical protein